MSEKPFVADSPDSAAEMAQVMFQSFLRNSPAVEPFLAMISDQRNDPLRLAQNAWLCGASFVLCMAMTGKLVPVISPNS